LGRTNCQDRYYQTTLFTRINTRDRDGLVVDFEERDFLEPGVQPRQLQAAAGDDPPPQRPAARRGAAPASAPTRDRPSR
jgi:hypothetical protein